MESLAGLDAFDMHCDLGPLPAPVDVEDSVVFFLGVGAGDSETTPFVIGASVGHAAGGKVVKVEGETAFCPADFTDLGEMAVATQENGGPGI